MLDQIIFSLAVTVNCAAALHCARNAATLRRARKVLDRQTAELTAKTAELEAAVTGHRKAAARLEQSRAAFQAAANAVADPSCAIDMVIPIPARTRAGAAGRPFTDGEMHDAMRFGAAAIERYLADLAADSVGPDASD